jgi:hypothetical protein
MCVRALCFNGDQVGPCDDARDGDLSELNLMWIHDTHGSRNPSNSVLSHNQEAAFASCSECEASGENVASISLHKYVHENEAGRYHFSCERTQEYTRHTYPSSFDIE